MNVHEHLLACLAEECAEIAHVCSESLRFGMEDINPLDPTGPNNRQWLVNELNDLAAVVILLTEHKILPQQWHNYDKILAEKAKVGKFLKYSEKFGALRLP